MKNLVSYFTPNERRLWCGSVLMILVAFGWFDGESYLTLAASLVGVTSLILNAKGNPLGQLLMVLFSLLYGIISYTFSYFGEMLTYLGMTMPMAVFALISWLKNPYNGNRAEVQVNSLARRLGLQPTAAAPARPKPTRRWSPLGFCLSFLIQHITKPRPYRP